MKKIIYTLLVVALILGCTLFSSCSLFGDDELPKEKTVMTIEMNPEVEFIISEENKVISVNALNEEGNLIITAETFVGKDAEEAAKLFVQVSKDLGFVVSGTSSIKNDDISISISGDAEKAEKMYSDAKAKMEEYLTAENITVTISEAKALTEEQLEQLLAECQPYAEAAEIKKLEYMELVEELYESRKETAELYSQELKNAYYEAKAIALDKAEFELLKAEMNEFEKIIIDGVMSVYNDAVTAIENARMENLVSEDSLYQKALKTFREKKTEYLKYRAEVAEKYEGEIPEDIQKILDGYEQYVTQAQTALDEVGEMANQAIDLAKQGLETARTAIITAIETTSVKRNEHLDEISAKQTEAEAKFFEDFEAGYAEFITASRDNWNSMKSELEAKTDADGTAE